MPLIKKPSTPKLFAPIGSIKHDDETFIVRHAYFTGADNPYDRLKRALKAEIDEFAWSALYSTQSYPFEKPTSGKIALKVINPYGEEVLKLYVLA
jgi:adenine-specific DNA-methyltransferase